MTSELLAAGLDPMDVLEEGVMEGLNDVGDRFAAKKAIVLDLVRAGVTAKACIPIIQDAFPEGEGAKIEKKRVPARKARKGVPNPFKPGELMDVAAKPASTKVKVRALKNLKDMV